MDTSSEQEFVNKQQDLQFSVSEQEHLLINAVGSIYPFIIHCNITTEKYQVLKSLPVHARLIKNSGTLDEFIDQHLKLISDDKNRDLFLGIFDKETLLSAYKGGKESLETRFQITTSEKHWDEAKIVFGTNQNNDVIITNIVI